MYDPGYQVYYWSEFGRFDWFGFYPFGELVDNIQPPDRKGPSDGDCLESGRGHVALIGKELATDAVLDKVLCVCLGRRPIETCTEGLAD